MADVVRTDGFEEQIRHCSQRRFEAGSDRRRVRTTIIDKAPPRRRIVSDASSTRRWAGRTANHRRGDGIAA
jgi:hypothetical protein